MIDNEIRATTIGVWFLPLNDKSDFFGVLQNNGDGCTFVIRFRYYTDPDTPASDNNDRRSWYTVSIAKDPAESIDAVRDMIEAMREQTGIIDPYDEVLNTGDFDGFVNDLLIRSWVNAVPEKA